MGNLVLNIMSKYGYIGIFILIAVENLFPPIPSEVILTFGGFLTTYSDLSPEYVIIAATIGSLLGALILYWAGSFLNVKSNDLAKTNNTFLKYGSKAVLWGRFIPIVRSLISIPAGINKMPLFPFILYTTIGSLGWNTILVFTGAFLGENWIVFANFLNKYSKIVLIILIVLCLYKLKKWITKKKNKDNVYQI